MSAPVGDEPPQGSPAAANPEDTPVEAAVRDQTRSNVR